MKYRKLRIAWSAMCGIVCLLLIVLYVRSYWRFDTWMGYQVMGGRVLPSLTISSSYGHIFVERTPNVFSVPFSADWDHFRRTVDSDILANLAGPVGFHFSPWNELLLPYWLLIMIFGALTASPWMGKFRCRFSLRTLLIAATVVAMILGVAVVMRRRS